MMRSRARILSPLLRRGSNLIQKLLLVGRRMSILGSSRFGAMDVGLLGILYWDVVSVVDGLGLLVSKIMFLLCLYMVFGCTLGFLFCLEGKEFVRTLLTFLAVVLDLS